MAIETPHGPVVETLLERGFNVYSINPKQLDRFRDRFTVAGAKDDRRDADVLGSSLRTDARAFRPLAPADPEIVELREVSRMAEEHGRDLRRYLSRMRDQLQRYFPAFLALGGDEDADWKLALIEMAPTPAMARSLPRAKVARLIKTHGVRCHDADAVLAILRAPAPAVSDATVAAAKAHVLALLRSIRLATEQLKEAKAELGRLTDALCEPEESEPGQTKQRDAAILPLLARHGQDHPRHAARRGTASGARARLPRFALSWRRCPGDQAVGQASLRDAGAVPVVRACRMASTTWARIAIQKDARCRAKYEALRARGLSWARALRSVADHLLYVACAMLKAGTLYDRKSCERRPSSPLDERWEVRRREGLKGASGSRPGPMHLETAPTSRFRATRQPRTRRANNPVREHACRCMGPGLDRLARCASEPRRDDGG